MTEKGANLTAASELIGKAARPLINGITTLLPIVITYVKIAHSWYVKLPTEHLNLLVGVIFCFLGGIYPVLFAAIEAAKHGGLTLLLESIKDLTEEATTIIEASKKDDAVDDDNDGIKDVNELNSTEYIIRKTNLVLVKMNPQKVDTAISHIYEVWLSIIAVLTVEFAQTIALALSMSEFIKKPLNRYLAPIVQAATPDDYDKWVPILFGWFTKMVAMSIAWYIQSILSAVVSAQIGAIMITQAIFRICRKNNWNPLGLLPESLEDTLIDEIFGYAFALLGVYVQFKTSFHVPFPLNLATFPFDWAEYYLKWTVTKVT